MHCAATRGLATNTLSATLGSLPLSLCLSVYFTNPVCLFYTLHVIQSLSLSLSSVFIYSSRRERWQFRLGGHGRKRSFSGGQRWKPLWSWGSIRERGKAYRSPRWADEPRLLRGHGGQRLRGVWAASLLRFQSRGSWPHFEPGLGLGLLRRRVL